MIRLTYGGKTIICNEKLIQDVYSTQDRTIVSFSEENYFYVDQTPEQVMEIIEGDESGKIS